MPANPYHTVARDDFASTTAAATRMPRDVGADKRKIVRRIG